MSLSAKIESALALARQHPGQLGHSEHVAGLSGQLFDALAPLHGLGAPERELLLCAALLHDIGLEATVCGHHRASMRLILEADLPAFNGEEKLAVANIARYHRKAHPSPRHAEFSALPPARREQVLRLAALLRLADGLDRAHEDAVKAISVAHSGSDTVTLLLHGPGDLAFAAQGAMRKADLFEEAYGVRLQILPAPTEAGKEQPR